MLPPLIFPWPRKTPPHFFHSRIATGGTLSDGHQSSMILAINVDAAEEHRYRLTPIICHLFYIYFIKVISRLTEHSDVITPLLRWAPGLGLTLGPALAKAGAV